MADWIVCKSAQHGWKVMVNLDNVETITEAIIGDGSRLHFAGSKFKDDWLVEETVEQIISAPRVR